MKKLILAHKVLSTFLRIKFPLIRSRGDLALYHERKLKNLINFLKDNSPYYQEALKDSHTNSLAELPIINKKIMVSEFNRINTVGLDRDECINLAINNEKSRDFSSQLKGFTVGLSSGTSGHRGLFVAGDEERAIFITYMVLKTLGDSLLKPHRVGYFLRSDSKLYKTDKDQKIKFKFFDPIIPLEEHIASLNEFAPTHLYAPPSILRSLSKFAKDGSLAIKPNRMVSIAEVLDPLDEKIIKENFRLDVLHQIYQCTEGLMGQTCPLGTIHLNEDLLIVEKEWLDDKKTKFNPVITDLYRKTQPHVRYRLNDVLTIKQGGCACGSPFLAIEQVEGRCDDIFYFKSNSNDSKVRVFSDFIRRTILFSSPEILEYQIIQKSIDHCHLHLKCSSDVKIAFSKIEKEFEKLSLDFGFVKPKLTFDETFEELGLKKLRRVVREFQFSEF